MYHFDYLTLLLAGVLDVQARIAHRVYKISKPIERYASFRNQDFLKVLRNCANQIHSTVTSQYNKDLISLIYLPRNTIHEAALRSLALHEGAKPQVSFVIVPEKDAEIFWETAERRGSREKWGVTKIGRRVLIEPYTYATTLVDEGLGLINDVALATEVARLFPDNYPIPLLSEQPPEDDVFSEKIRKRLAVLG